MSWGKLLLGLAAFAVVKNIAESQTNPTKSSADKNLLAKQARATIRTEQVIAVINNHRKTLWETLARELNTEYQANISCTINADIIAIELTNIIHIHSVLERIKANFSESFNTTNFCGNTLQNFLTFFTIFYIFNIFNNF